MKASNPSTCLSPGTLALTLVCQSWEQLPLTPQNVVIVVISLAQKELRMTTFLRVKIALKQRLSLSALANDDVVKFDATPSGLKGQNNKAQWQRPGCLLSMMSSLANDDGFRAPARLHEAP